MYGSLMYGPGILFNDRHCDLKKIYMTLDGIVFLQRDFFLSSVRHLERTGSDEFNSIKTML